MKAEDMHERPHGALAATLCPILQGQERYEQRCRCSKLKIGRESMSANGGVAGARVDHRLERSSPPFRERGWRECDEDMSVKLHIFNVPATGLP